jgi:two-component system chemotaxis sensor kinase CheA
MSDDETYRKLFVAESQENHENLVKNLLVLEEGSDANAIDEIFRAAHTLKGMSASMGYDVMEMLCHSMEDVFDEIRNGSKNVTPDLVNLLLNCTDSIEEMLDDIEAGGDSSSVDATDLVHRLLAETGKGDPTGTPEFIEQLCNAESGCDSSTGGVPPARPDGATGSRPTHRVTVTIDPSSMTKDIRALMILQNLENAGTVIASRPSTEYLEGDSADFDGMLEIDLESMLDAEEITSLASIPEVASVSVSPNTTTASPTGGAISSDIIPEYLMRITVAEDCTMKDVRALIALENLKQMATIIRTTPGEMDLDDGKFEGTLEIMLSSDAGREALLSAVQVTDIASTYIDELSGDTHEFMGSSCDMMETIPDERKTGQKRPDKASKAVQNIRVDIHKLDQMMTMVEDLVINGGRLRQLARQYNNKEVDEAMGMVGRSISELQNMMINIRMIPLDQIFKRFPRVVRDVANHDGKEVEFCMEGGDTEMDRSVIDGLGDPLLHLIRNAVNHGIETPEERIRRGKDPRGTIRLRAWRERGNVVIELSDNGGGINTRAVLEKAVQRGLAEPGAGESLSKEEIIAFLFQPGFSTAETITDISGRGVGLDVVKSTIESLQGSIAVTSEEGEGTTFTLTLPPTMAIIEVMMVRINGSRCAIPINSVVEVAKIKTKDIIRIGKSEAIPFRDDVLQIHRLEEMFGQNGSGDIIVVVQYQGHKCCVPVDIVEGQQEVVVKPLSRVIGACRGVSGVTIPGDGDVIPIIDVNTMV